MRHLSQSAQTPPQQPSPSPAMGLPVLQSEQLYRLELDGINLEEERLNELNLGENKYCSAIARADLKGLSLLFQNGEAPLGLVETKESLLHVAVWCDQWEVVVFLVDQGYYVNALDRDLRTPIQFAALLNRPKCIDALLRLEKTSLTNLDRYGKTFFHYLAMNGDCNSVLNAREDLERKRKCNLEPKSALDTTPLWWAVAFNQEEMVEFLLSAGGTSMWVDKQGSTLLHLAVFRAQNIKIVRLLIKFGASGHINVLDNKRETPLALARGLSDLAIYDFLFENKQTTQPSLIPKGASREGFFYPLYLDKRYFFNELHRAKNYFLTKCATEEFISIARQCIKTNHIKNSFSGKEKKIFLSCSPFESQSDSLHFFEREKNHQWHKKHIGLLEKTLKACGASVDKKVEKTETSSGMEDTLSFLSDAQRAEAMQEINFVNYDYWVVVGTRKYFEAYNKVEGEKHINLNCQNVIDSGRVVPVFFGESLEDVLPELLRESDLSFELEGRGSFFQLMEKLIKKIYGLNDKHSDFSDILDRFYLTLFLLEKKVCSASLDDGTGLEHWTEIWEACWDEARAEVGSRMRNHSEDYNTSDFSP